MQLRTRAAFQTGKASQLHFPQGCLIFLLSTLESVLEVMFLQKEIRNRKSTTMELERDKRDNLSRLPLSNGERNEELDPFHRRKDEYRG